MPATLNLEFKSNINPIAKFLIIILTFEHQADDSEPIK